MATKLQGEWDDHLACQEWRFIGSVRWLGGSDQDDLVRVAITYLGESADETASLRGRLTVGAINRRAGNGDRLVYQV